MKKFGTAAVFASIATMALIPTGAIAGGAPDGKCTKATPKYCPEVKKGRMTGHGHFIDSELGKIQWEFRNMVCNSERFPDLKVEWGDNRFKLTDYTSGPRCFDTPYSEGRPLAGFDTIIGAGTGTLNGEPASVTFQFTDAGEPGRADRATITIMQDGEEALVVDNVVASAGGNHQAHRASAK